MSLASGLAIYFIIWWLTLFIVLPFGVRNAHETGHAVDLGNEPGAPVKARLWRKAGINTILSTVIFILFYLAKTRGWLSLDLIPFYNSMPNPY